MSSRIASLLSLSSFPTGVVKNCSDTNRTEGSAQPLRVRFIARPVSQTVFPQRSESKLPRDKSDLLFQEKLEWKAIGVGLNVFP